MQVFFSFLCYAVVDFGEGFITGKRWLYAALIWNAGSYFVSEKRRAQKSVEPVNIRRCFLCGGHIVYVYAVAVTDSFILAAFFLAAFLFCCCFYPN